MKLSEPQARLYRHWLALVSVIAGLYIIWLNTAPFALGKGLFPAVLVFLVRLLVAWVCLQALPKILEVRRSTTWRILVVGLLIQLFVDGLAVVEWSLTGTLTGAPSIRDLLRLAGFLAIGYSLVTYPMSHPERFGRVREGLDAFILIFAILALSWLIFFRPSTRTGYLDIPQVFWLSIYPVLDILLLVFALRQALLRIRIRKSLPFFLIFAAASISFISDLGASFEGLDAPPSASLIQVGWIASASLFGLAVQRAAGQREERAMALDHEPIVRLASRMEPLIPVALTYTVVAYLLFDWWFSGELDWVGVGVSALLIVLLFARQAVIAGQQELRQFAALVHATGDLAFVADPDGDLRMANPALIKELGESAETNLPGVPSFIRVGAAGEYRIEELLEQALRQGWSGEVDLIKADGSSLPVLLSLDPVISARSGEIMIAGTAHDLSLIRKREEDLRVALDDIDAARTELAQLNAELEHKVDERTQELKQTVAELASLNEELTTLDRLKSEFVALVSHELRSPLTNIRSGIEVILESQTGVPSDTRESLSLVEAETHRLSQFVETILDLSALEAGKFPFEEQEFHVKDAFAAACSRLAPQLEGRDVNLEIESVLQPLKTDRAALESVLYHLLDNSSKYAPQGSIDVHIWQEDSRTFCSISDHGLGIPDDQQERVFEMFHRLDASDAREVYGHGLGLPMVKRLLEALGGDIDISASSTDGTTMTFWVPTGET